MSGGNKANLSKKEIDDILRFGTEELFNQVRSNKMNFTNLSTCRALFRFFIYFNFKLYKIISVN
jgi:hypothetical protein